MTISLSSVSLDRSSPVRHNRVMSAAEIDAYLAALDEPKRSTLAALRRTILDILPDPEQCISYSMPAFRVDGKVVAGFAAFSKHLAYLPHSGSVFRELEQELAGYEQTKGSLHFSLTEPLPKPLVEKLIGVRMAQLGLPPARTAR